MKEKHNDEVCEFFYSFVWGAEKRDVVARNTVGTDKLAGCMGLVRLKEIYSSFYIYHNLMRRLEQGFNHHRDCPFRYNASCSMINLCPAAMH